MSGGVNILTRNSPASSGAQTATGKLFLAGPIGSGPTTAPAECTCTADFEAAFSTRTGAAVPAWDYLDLYFQEGGNLAYVIDYTTAGNYAPALALLDSRLGPGQVGVVGEAASSTLYSAIATHCAANNRVGLLDVKSTDASAAAIEVEGALVSALTSPSGVGAFGSWPTAPPPAGVVGGTARTLPTSAAVAALCNRVDQNLNANGDPNPNQPAGGPDYPLQYATGIVYDPNDTDWAACLTSGVNMVRDRYGVLENYSFQSGLAPTTTTPFWQLNASRAQMWLKAQSAQAGEEFYMSDLDGEGRLTSQIQSRIGGLCKRLYEAGGLYGMTPADAYSVNVGLSVNNNGTAALAQLNVVASLTYSLYAAQVNITLVSIPIIAQVS